MNAKSPCKTILIVEDNTAIRETVQDVLETEGYRAFAASNGLEALKTLKTLAAPTLILLDMMMPQMNGWEFLEGCKEVRKSDDASDDPSIVVMSALDATA